MEVTIAFLIGAVTGFLLGNSRTRNWLVSMVNRTQTKKPAAKKRKNTNRKKK